MSRKVLIALGVAGAMAFAAAAGVAVAQGPGRGEGPPWMQGEGRGFGPPHMMRGEGGGWGQGRGEGGGWGQGRGEGRGWGFGGGWGNPEAMRARMERRFQRGFDLFDRNLDGVIEWSEVQAVLGRRFAEMDTNNDGAITRADIEARIASRMQRGPGRGMPDEMRTQFTTRAVERFMGRFGQPADGRVTREQFVAQFEPVFRMMNRSGDGRLTRPQVEEFFALMRMMRG